MGKIDEYRQKLQNLESWDDFLRQESRLPGPRANLELAFAVASEGTREQIQRYANLDSNQAPYNTPDEFLAFCGVLGLGYLMARGEGDYFGLLRKQASDSRWRIREAVALGLQKYGQTSMEHLLEMMREWAKGTLLERRAVVASLCEPSLLENLNDTAKVIDIINQITATILDEADRRSGEFGVLKKGLGYGWSVVVAAQPSIGKPIMEQWIGSQDPDIRWIMRQNLKKKRLIKMDESWVLTQLEVLG